eukprot:6617764-Lingulodinium_polyedra.AAC.1
MQCWCAERAGVQHSPDRARGLLGQSGVPSAARRLQPFFAWIACRDGCTPARAIPGHRVGAQSARLLA